MIFCIGRFALSDQIRADGIRLLCEGAHTARMKSRARSEINPEHEVFISFFSQGIEKNYPFHPRQGCPVRNPVDFGNLLICGH